MRPNVCAMVACLLSLFATPRAGAGDATPRCDAILGPRRPTWDIDGPAPDLSGSPEPPTQLPGYTSWAKDHKLDKMTRDAGCIHCHQVAEVLRQHSLDSHSFDKHRDLDMWPLPENVGI